MENVYAIAVIIGLVNGVQLYNKKDKKSFYYFCTALAAGVLFGFLHWFTLDGIPSGIVAALASSGLLKVATRIGGE